MAQLPDARWELAALARAEGKTLREAYTLAGLRYDAASASRFFRRPDIAARVRELLAQFEARLRAAQQRAVDDASVDASWVIRHLKHNALMALRGDPVFDRRGQPTGNLRPDRHAANRALELLGRTIGLFVEKVEVGRPGDFAHLSDEELEAKIVALLHDAGFSGELANLCGGGVSR